MFKKKKEDFSEIVEKTITELENDADDADSVNYEIEISYQYITRRKK